MEEHGTKNFSKDRLITDRNSKKKPNNNTEPKIAKPGGSNGRSLFLRGERGKRGELKTKNII